MAILPLFIVLRQIGLLNNPLGVALPQAAFGLPISIVIMRPFFRAIPQELQDAAAIDGCGPFRFYWSIMLPLSRPVLSTIAVITIVSSWNAFLLPLLVLAPIPTQHTLPIGVNNISSQYSTDYRARPRLHDAVDDPGTDLLRGRRAPDRQRPHRRRGEGMSDATMT